MKTVNKLDYYACLQKKIYETIKNQTLTISDAEYTDLSQYGNINEISNQGQNNN